MPRPSAPARTLGSAWLPRRGQRRGHGLTRGDVVAAGVRLLDAEGLAGITMRRVATELDSGVTSLYWHVTDKDELLDLICDEVLSEVEIPATSPGDAWKQQLCALLVSLRAALLGHRNVVVLLSSRPNVGPNALRLREAIAACLHAAGLNPVDTRAADHALLAYTIGTCSAETAAASAALEQGVAPEVIERQISDYLAGLAEEDYPNLAAMGRLAPTATADELFMFGLESLLVGVQALSRR